MVYSRSADPPDELYACIVATLDSLESLDLDSKTWHEIRLWLESHSQ